MSVVNFYRDVSAYTALTIAELGEISSGGSNYVEAFGEINGCDIAVYLNDYIDPDSISGTCINFLDDGSEATINLYTNANLQNGFRATNHINNTTGYLTQMMLLSNNVVGSVRASYEDYSMTYRPSRVYLALATVNGVQRFGFLGINDRNPSSGGFRRWNGFFTNAAWSDTMLEEMHFIDTSNPYSAGGYSEPGGGDPQKQNWTEDSDFVKEDAMPDEEFYGAIATGLVTLFHPTKEQLRRLASVLWADSFWNFVQNAIQNIGDLFISLGMMPFYITGGDNVEVTWFNYAVTGATSKTDVYLRLCENQFMEFDMGSIALDGSDDRIFATDSVLDYSPYSKLGIFLPFIGYQELDIDECRGQILYLKYRVDILSGTCVALISLRPLGEDPQNSRTIYQFTGNCLTQLPLTAVDAQTMITNAVNLGISLVGVGTAGAIASAGDAVTAELQTRENHPISAAQGELRNKQGMASVASAGGSLASATVNAVMGMKPDFKHSGAIGASSSLLSVKQPYLFLTTPRQSMPEGYNKVCGFPCNIYGNIGDFEGFTVVEDVRLNGLVATSPEVEEIYYLLKKGIII